MWLGDGYDLRIREEAQSVEFVALLVNRRLGDGDAKFRDAGGDVFQYALDLVCFAFGIGDESPQVRLERGSDPHHFSHWIEVLSGGLIVNTPAG
jgi:hypothetical protein